MHLLSRKSLRWSWWASNPDLIHFHTSLCFFTFSLSAHSLWLQSLSITGSLTLSSANNNPLKLKLERSHIPSVALSRLAPLSLFTPPTAVPTLNSHPFCCQSAASRGCCLQLHWATELPFRDAHRKLLNFHDIVPSCCYLHIIAMTLATASSFVLRLLLSWFTMLKSESCSTRLQSLLHCLSRRKRCSIIQQLCLTGTQSDAGRR